MKPIHRLLFDSCILFLLLALGACSMDNKDSELQTQEELQVHKAEKVPIYEDGKIVGYADEDDFRKATDAELQEFYKLGWLSFDQIETRAHTCQWADGFGGSINCNGGACHTVFTTNPDGTQSAGTGCYIDNQLSHAGLFRPRN